MDRIALEASEVERVPWDVNALRCLTPKTVPLKALRFFPLCLTDSLAATRAL